MKENISKFITYKEATHSATADRNNIENVPNEEQLTAMKLVAEEVFEKVREHFGVPIGVNSFFRCLKLNKVLNGSKTSQHMDGEAIDMDGIGVDNVHIFNYIKDNLEFDQLIWEYGTDENPAWVHVSFSSKKNRKKILRAVKGEGCKPYKKK